MTIHDNAPPSLRGNIMGLAEKIYHEGEEKGVIKVAKNMLAEGTDPIFVAKVTGLPLDVVKKLKSEKK